MNMEYKKIFLTLLLILFSKISYAENWVCYDKTNGKITIVVQGDCLQLGLCSDFNNQGLRNDCFEASKEEFEKSKQSFVKVDKNIVSGSKVVDLDQIEKDTNIFKKTQEQKQIQIDAVDNLRVSVTDLINGFVSLGIVDIDTLKNQIKQNKGLQ